MSGRSPPSYCTLTLIAMQGHQQKGRQINTSSNNRTNPIQSLLKRAQQRTMMMRIFIIQVHDPVVHLWSRVDQKHKGKSICLSKWQSRPQTTRVTSHTIPPKKSSAPACPSIIPNCRAETGTNQLHSVVPRTFLHLLVERDYNCSLGSLKMI